MENKGCTKIQKDSKTEYNIKIDKKKLVHIS